MELKLRVKGTVVGLNIHFGTVLPLILHLHGDERRAHAHRQLAVGGVEVLDLPAGSVAAKTGEKLWGVCTTVQHGAHARTTTL